MLNFEVVFPWKKKHVGDVFKFLTGRLNPRRELHNLFIRSIDSPVIDVQTLSKSREIKKFETILF